MGTRCTATTTKGRPCKGWAVRGTDPPRCAPHGGTVRPHGMPEDRGDADKAGGPNKTEEHIADLDRRIARLRDYIDEQTPDLAPGDLTRLLDTYSKLIERVTRVRGARQQMEGSSHSPLTDAIHRALDRIGKEWGIQL